MNREQKEQPTGSAAVLGCGNMGGAIVRGLCRAGVFPAQHIVCCDTDERKLDKLAKDLGVRTTTDAGDAVSGAEVVIVAVKPPLVNAVLQDVRKKLAPGTVLLSIAGAIPVAQIRAAAGKEVRIGRVMPSLPCLVGKGMSCVYAEETDVKEVASRLFSSVGRCEFVEKENDLDVVTALSGSGPGFLCLVLEAMTDGAVKMGLPREKAEILAAQTMLGTGALVLESKEKAAKIREQVTTPAGTTIEGLHELERGACRSLFISAVEAATLRARELKEELKS